MATAYSNDFKVKNGLVVTTTATILSTLTSVSVASGALIVNGGAGISKDVYVGGVIYGTSGVKITGLTTVTNTTDASSTVSGALQIAGGAGIGGNLYVGGTIVAVNTITGIISTASNLAGGAQGSLHYQSAPGITSMLAIGTNGYVLTSNGTIPQWNALSGLSAGTATTATNLANGAAGQIPYQQGSGSTGFASSGTIGQLLVSGGLGAPVFTTTSTIQVGYAANVLGGGNGALVYQPSANTTNFLNTGTPGQVLLAAVGAPSWATTTTLYVGASVSTEKLFGGIAGQFVYQTGSGATGFISTSAIYVNSSRFADELTGGTAGQLHYQVGPNDSGFLSTGTTGQLLVAAAGAPVWTNTGSLYVGTSASSDDIRGGTAGQLLYQLAAGNTDYLSTGTTGQILVAAAGAPVWTNTSSLYVNRATLADVATSVAGSVTTATNILGGTVGQIPYQTGTNLTSFFGPGTAGQILVSNGASIPLYVSTSSIYVNSAKFADDLTGGTAGQLHYQINANDTGFLSTGTTGQLLAAAAGAPVWTNTSSLYVGASVSTEKLFGGGNGALVYQPSANTTNFLSTGTPGQILLAAVGAPSWTSTSSIYVNSAKFADDLTGGTAGQLHYQIGANDSGFLSTGTTGQLLVAAAGAPAWTSTSSIYVNSSRYTDNVTGGTAGQLHYQSAANTTQFLSTGTTGQLLVAAAGAPVWTNTGSLYVARSTYADSAGSVSATVTTATNVAGGGSGALLYQPSANTTNFLSTGTPGQVLLAAVGAPSWTNTSTIYVNSARYSDELTGGTAGQLHYQIGPNDTGFLTTGTTGQLLVAAAGAPVWTNTGSLYVGASIATEKVFGGGAGALLYQPSANTTNFLSTGTPGQILSAAVGAPTWITTTTAYVGTAIYADDVRGGTAGQILYQTAANATGYVTTASVGQVLTSNGVLAPAYVTTTSLYVGRATIADAATSVSATVTTATNLANGAAGQIPYQTAPNATSFASSGTTGQILLSGGLGAPTWASTSTIYVNSSRYADELTGGTAGQLVYQIGANDTGFLSTGTTGQVLVAAAGAPVWTSTGSLYVNRATLADSANSVSATVTTSTNISGGGAGALLYQPSTNTTNFLSTGTPGQVLLAAVGAPAWTSTSSIYVNSARYSDELTGGTAGQLVYQIGANDTGFLSTGTTGQVLVAAAGAPVWTSTSSIYVNSAKFANDLTGGTAGQLVYQIGANDSGFLSTGTTGQLLVAAAGAPTWTNTGSLYVGASVITEKLFGGGNGALVYQSASNTTQFLSTGTTGQLLVAAGGAPAWTNTSSIYVNSSKFTDNLTGGTAGQLPYQSAANTTLFSSSGTTGQLLLSGGLGAPTWASTSSIYVNSSRYTDNVTGGTAGQLHYQSAPNTTQFLSTGTTGQLLVAAAGAPIWTNTSSLYVGASISTEKIFGGGSGALVYQPSPNTTNFLSTGTPGQLLTSAVGAPAWINTTTAYVGTAVYADNTRGGTAGQILYQIGTNITGYVTTATTGQVLTSNGVLAPSYVTTTSLYVGRATLADSASAVASVVNTATNANNIAVVQGVTNASHYVTFVNSNNATSAYNLVYTTSTLMINPSTGNINLNLTAATANVPMLDVGGPIRTTGSNGTVGGDIRWCGDGAGYGLTFRSQNTPANSSTLNPVVMTLLDNGNVGIGTTSPGALLDINNGAIRLSPAYQIQWFSGSTQLGSILCDSGPNITFQTGSTNSEKMRIDSNGNVGIGLTPSGTYKLEINGSASATLFNTTSDKKLKTDIETVKDAGNIVNKLNGVSFRWKKDGKKSYGVIAQEIEEIIPDVVVTDNNDAKTVNYNAIIAFLIEANKELHQRVKHLEDLVKGDE